MQGMSASHRSNASSMKFLSTWLRNTERIDSPLPRHSLLNEVPEHMAQEFGFVQGGCVDAEDSSMKFLSTWLRNGLLIAQIRGRQRSSMKFLSTWLRNRRGFLDADTLGTLLNEVPEHMAQESDRRPSGLAGCRGSSMKFLSTWLRNCGIGLRGPCRWRSLLNEVPEHMAQESARARRRIRPPRHLLNEVPEHMAQECALQ